MAKNKKKKRSFIVDKQKSNTPYHLKKRNSNITDHWITKVVVWLMILAFVAVPIVGLVTLF